MAAALVKAESLFRQAKEAAQTDTARALYDLACQELENVLGFLSTPENILGSDGTKHGQIAELMEIAFRNARGYLKGEAPSATAPDKQTLPYDLFINMVKVQMKTCNGANNSLRHVLGHMAKYENFGRDGSYYLIPKDQYEIITRVLNNNTAGLSERTVNAVLAHVKEVERLTNSSFGDVVKPSSTNYPDVQRCTAENTIEDVRDELTVQQEQKEADIKAKNAPSLKGGLKTAAASAGIAGGFTLAYKLGTKYFVEDKNVFKGDFTEKDWKEIGVDVGRAGLSAGITSGAIYGLSNWGRLPAPVAGAFVGATCAVGVLVRSYDKGVIDEDTLVDQAMFACAEVSVVTVFAVLGQVAIPVPVLGALLGSVAGNYASSLLSSVPQSALKKLQARILTQNNAVDLRHQRVMQAISVQFASITRLTEFAFSEDANTACLKASADLADAWGVPEAQVLRTKSDVLGFLSAPAYQ